MTLYDGFRSTEEGRRLLNRAALNVAVTESILERMQEEGVTRRTLSKRLGISKRKLNRLLNDERPLKLSMVADMLTALRCQLEVQVTNRLEEQ